MQSVTYWKQGGSTPASSEASLLRSAPAGLTDDNGYTAITLVDDEQGAVYEPAFLCDPEAGCDGTNGVIGGSTLTADFFQPMVADSYSDMIRIDLDVYQIQSACVSTLNQFTIQGNYEVTGAATLAMGATIISVLALY